MRLPRSAFWFSLFAYVLATAPATAQEPAYFVTYDHCLEEPDNLGIGLAKTSLSTLR